MSFARRTFMGGLALIVALETLGSQEARVTGVVRDMDDRAVAYATIFVQPKGVSAVADDSGRFRLDSVPFGTARLEVKRLGYLPTQVAMVVSGDTAIDVSMLAVPHTLPATEVTARSKASLERVGFYERMDQAKRGALGGTFLTAEDIEKRRPLYITHALDKAPGVKIRYMPGGAAVPTGGDGSCIMAIYLDGARLDLYGNNLSNGASGGLWARMTGARKSAGGSAPGPVEGLDKFLTPNSVAGIEIYPRAVNAPGQYQSLNGTCGIILIWTKPG